MIRQNQMQQPCWLASVTSSDYGVADITTDGPAKSKQEGEKIVFQATNTSFSVCLDFLFCSFPSTHFSYALILGVIV